MRKSFLIIILVLLPLSSIAYGEWKEIFETMKGTKYYIDIDRIKITEQNHRRAWTKYKYKPTKLTGDKIATHVLSYDEYDCKLERLRNLQTTIFYKNGESKTGNFQSDWFYTMPKTAEEEQLRYICFAYKSKQNKE